MECEMDQCDMDTCDITRVSSKATQNKAIESCRGSGKCIEGKRQESY